MAHRFQLVEQYDMTGRLDRIRVPTLIMAGDRDLLVSEASLDALCTNIADSQLVRFAKCGHLAAVTEPGRVAEAVRRFLDP